MGDMVFCHASRLRCAESDRLARAFKTRIFLAHCSLQVPKRKAKLVEIFTRKGEHPQGYASWTGPLIAKAPSAWVPVGRNWECLARWYSSVTEENELASRLKPGGPEQSGLARPLRQLDRFPYNINAHRVFGMPTPP
jgi:hypothetical protein